MKVLFVDCCIRGAGISRTRKLCDFFLEQLSHTGAEFELETLDLDNLPLAPLDRADLEHKEKLEQKGAFDDQFYDYAREFAAADYILVGAPYWNLTLPSKLKAYLEWVCMVGVAFRYEGSDSVGMCNAKRMLLISSSGGDLYGVNNGMEYLRQLSLEMLGIQEFEYCGAEGLDIQGRDVEKIVQATQQRLKVIAEKWLK